MPLKVNTVTLDTVCSWANKVLRAYCSSMYQPLYRRVQHAHIAEQVLPQAVMYLTWTFMHIAKASYSYTLWCIYVNFHATSYIIADSKAYHPFMNPNFP